MATIIPSREGSPAREQSPLYAGQHLLQSEFHRLYSALPEDQKFELLDGIVYMAAAQRRPHSRIEPLFSALLIAYDTATPGVEMLHNATTILDEKNEPQPDLQLRILSEYGGHSHVTSDLYIAGPPELIVESAHSSLHMDLKQKPAIYQQQGVAEYWVVDIEAARIHCFGPRGVENRIHADGILKSVMFPGLWVNVEALFLERNVDLQDTLNQGLQQSEHAAFVANLQSAKTQS